MANNRLAEDDLPKLRAEVEKYKLQYQKLEGATSQIIDAVRMKWMNDSQSIKENYHGKIVYADEETMT